jgi:hypothetical protein
MKVRATIFYLVCFALYCGGETNGVPSGTQDLQEMKSSLERVKDPSVPEQEMEALALGNAQFAVDAYKYFAMSKEEYLLISIEREHCACRGLWGRKGQDSRRDGTEFAFLVASGKATPCIQLTRPDIGITGGCPCG